MRNHLMQIGAAARRIALPTLFAFFSGAALAQSTYGTITGVLTDPSNAVLRDATVEATSTSTNVARSVKTDAEGFYRLVNLDPGSYTISASASGFAPVQQKNVNLWAARATTATTWPTTTTSPRTTAMPITHAAIAS